METRQEVFDPRRPLYVKHPSGLNLGGTSYKKNQEIPWIEKSLDELRMRTLFKEGFVHHDSDREMTKNVGDRISEMTITQVHTLYTLLNEVLQKRLNNADDFRKQKIKHSKVQDRQVALIRTWIYRNPWVQDDFKTIRDKILGESSN